MIPQGAMIIRHSHRGHAVLVEARQGKRWRWVAAFAYRPGKTWHEGARNRYQMLQNARAWRFAHEIQDHQISE